MKAVYRFTLALATPFGLLLTGHGCERQLRSSRLGSTTGFLSRGHQALLRELSYGRHYNRGPLEFR